MNMPGVFFAVRVWPQSHFQKRFRVRYLEVFGGFGPIEINGCEVPKYL